MDKRSATCVKPLVRGVWIPLGDYQRRLPLGESAAYQIEKFLKLIKITKETTWHNFLKILTAMDFTNI
jgi:hypothetical protein